MKVSALNDLLNAALTAAGFSQARCPQCSSRLRGGRCEWCSRTPQQQAKLEQTADVLLEMVVEREGNNE